MTKAAPLLLLTITLACGPSSESPASDGAAQAADGGAPATGACAPIAEIAPTVCSMTGPARDVLFTNGCAIPVDIWWVNAQCGETFYRRLQPSESYTQGSFVTHPWRARTVPAGVPMGTAKGMLIKEFGAIPPGTDKLPFSLP